MVVEEDGGDPMVLRKLSAQSSSRKTLATQLVLMFSILVTASPALPTAKLSQFLAGFNLVLKENAILAPHWNIKAHSVLSADNCSTKFGVIKKAGNEGFEYIAFKTNDNAMTSQLAGRLSAIRAIPEEVLMSSYQISREEVKNLKYGREEDILFSRQFQQGRRESA
ncbi:hypothetical protein ACH5RR_031526 [Cinchona calisaya]|uniref:Cupin type-1 domain-containing protein n=1 Tax=Cinchona calisaya TaxID=153742 RepID=A0ABD2YFI1_9GENT